MCVVFVFLSLCEFVQHMCVVRLWCVYVVCVGVCACVGCVSVCVVYRLWCVIGVCVSVGVCVFCGLCVCRVLCE